VQLLLSVLGLVSSLLLSFISSGMETALYRVSRVRMRIRSDRGDTRARMVLGVLERLDAMVTAILINNNIAAYAGAYFLTLQLAIWRVPHSEIITTAVITPLFFVLTESLPKQLAYTNADAFSLELVRVFVALRKIFSPAIRLLNTTSALLRKAIGSRGDATLSRSQRAMLLEHLSAGVADNILTREQNSMAVRIMHLEGIGAEDSMIPLSRILLLPGSSSRSGALSAMARRGANMALLTDSGGRPTNRMLTATALLMRQGKPDDGVEDAAEPLERIRAGSAIPEALNLFRKRHARNALVVQGNRVIGLITTRSVLDRIAGRSGQ
jgi:CBS domain containing-hemolysin-like protein